MIVVLLLLPPQVFWEVLHAIAKESNSAMSLGWPLMLKVLRAEIPKACLVQTWGLFPGALFWHI